ncbi:SMC-Scp complex subunit ScpB [Micromonospora sp. NBS 11-29]|uniref:SMC-Scp complex subunit ScpB n=1 Tax=Micromonospora sp. NBS 11-29 TaxID=1960879 RepID=UPI000B77C89C|nr:SMC-Scp complex subunit ScpB [Micromonospora sp. NBS 11-29]
MSDEERRDSLADQAAAWIPPWERPTPPKPPSTNEPKSPAGPPADRPSAQDLDPPADLGSNRPPEGPNSSKISSTGEAERDLGTGAPLEGRDRTKISGSERGADDVPGKRGRRRVAAEPAPAPVLDDAELRGALEAILLVVDQPVSELVLAEVLEQAPARVGAMLDEIAGGYTTAGHGFELRRAAGGWRLYTRPEYATYVERFVLDGQSVRLTQAALETLAVVAYRQPVTRSRISAIRGVNCDGVLRTLVGRGLVEECGTEADSGAFLYRTTTLFLEKLGLNSVDDLPPLAPFLPDDVEELADATR